MIPRGGSSRRRKPRRGGQGGRRAFAFSAQATGRHDVRLLPGLFSGAWVGGPRIDGAGFGASDRGRAVYETQGIGRISKDESVEKQIGEQAGRGGRDARAAQVVPWFPVSLVSWTKMVYNDSHERVHKLWHPGSGPAGTVR
jgi:hypothetical protein